MFGVFTGDACLLETHVHFIVVDLSSVLLCNAIRPKAHRGHQVEDK